MESLETMKGFIFTTWLSVDLASSEAVVDSALGVWAKHVRVQQTPAATGRIAPNLVRSAENIWFIGDWVYGGLTLVLLDEAFPPRRGRAAEFYTDIESEVL